jgi:hypothetical protein
MGKNISKYVIEVLKEYDIKSNLGYFVIDNILDNNIIIIVLSLVLRHEFRLTYDPIYYCICC